MHLSALGNSARLPLAKLAKAAAALGEASTAIEDRVQLRGESASQASTPEQPSTKLKGLEVRGRFSSERWAWTEHLFDNDPHFKQQNFHPRGAQRDAEVVAAFGTDKPHSGSVLLHYAGPPAEGVERQPNPVLLVHGANKNGQFWWDPHEDGSDQGLPQRLREQGFEVYALSFAHPHDDNFLQTEQLANCLDRIQELSGAKKVDLVAHSKGGASARTYVSDLRQDWMKPYANNVGKLILVGAANGGIDTSFRNSASNFALMSESSSPLLNAPMSWDSAMMGFFPVDVRDRSFSNETTDCFPGQDQLLARWDSKYPIGMWQQDWWTTYHGGQGFVSRSKGIEHYIAQGGNFIARLNEAKIDPKVHVVAMAGNRANIPGIINETAGPSDGLVFVDSALQVPAQEKVVLPYHHKALVSEAEPQQWIVDALKK
jgi:triacylglycerol lipase